MITCKCPKASSLTAIEAVTCSENFGQIQKIAFQRIFKDDGSKNFFDSAADPTAPIEDLATWTPLLAASDSTKIVVSPYVQAPTNTAGDARTFGGGNETLGGREEVIGRNPSTFESVIRKAPQEVIEALKDLQDEVSCSGSIGVYLFNGNGQIEAIKDSSIDTKFYPIPIQTMFVGDKEHGGLEAPDGNKLNFSFPPNYSDGLKIITPTFNPLTDLVP